MTTNSSTTKKELLTLSVVALLLIAYSGAMWFAWLGWDSTYYLDDQGYPAGPYRAWQVIGCAAALVVGVVAAYLHTRHLLAIVFFPIASIIGFLIPWSVHASSEDETGMWVVGQLMILVGGTLGLFLVMCIALIFARPLKRNLTGGTPRETSSA